MQVRVVYHRTTYRSNGRPSHPRLGKRQETTTEIRPGRKIIRGQKTRIDGLLRLVLSHGYENGQPVIHVAR